jgi:nitroreductase
MHVESSATAAEYARFVRSLRSVRRFAPTPIPDDVLREVLDITRWTGSAKNSQPWEVVVVRDRDTLEHLASLGTFAGHLAGAQVGVVLVMDDEQRRLDEGRLAQNLMLAAWAYGIGSCIATMQPADNVARAKDRLGIPGERWLSTVISLGYPADAQALRRGPELGRAGVVIGRKPTVQFVSWERFGQRNP